MPTARRRRRASRRSSPRSCAARRAGAAASASACASRTARTRRGARSRRRSRPARAGRSSRASGCSMKPATSRPSPAAHSAAPAGRRGRPPSARGAAACAAATASRVAAAIGTLMRKMSRQLETPMSQPPSSGPMTKEMPLHAVHVPIAAPRSGPENVDVITASDAGVRSAPAMPWMPRKTMSVVAFGAAAQSTDATPNARDAQREHPHLSEDVAERAADEDERAEREQIGVDDPQLGRDPAAEVALDRGQGDVDDRPVDEGDRRAENRRRERDLARPIHLRTPPQRQSATAPTPSGPATATLDP